MQSFWNKKASQGIFFPREAYKRGSTPIFRSFRAVTGASRGAFDPDAQRTHFGRAARKALSAEEPLSFAQGEPVTFPASSHK